MKSFIATVLSFLVFSSNVSAGTVGTANLARLGVATQSTTDSGGVAPRGNDGGLGTSFGDDATTTHTDGGTDNNFWRVDLGSVLSLESVELFNRGDCCPERLTKFRLSVLDAGLSEVYGLNVGSSFPNLSTVYALPANTTGRYVQVQSNAGNNDGGNNVVSLREVRVMGQTNAINGSNLAAKYGVATQSTTLSHGSIPAAHKALDGNTSDSFGSNSITHSNGDANPNWQVDLGEQYTLDHVNVYGRWEGSGALLNRLSNYTVRVLDENLVTTYSQFFDNAPPFVTSNGVHQNVPLPLGTQGRYVRVEMTSPNDSGDNTLSLAEVVVNGGLSRNVARLPGATTNASSFLGGGYEPSKGVDANTDAKNSTSSFFHSASADVDPTWEIDLGQMVPMQEFVIHNRQDCCGGRLRDLTIQVYDSSNVLVFDTFVASGGFLNAGNVLGGGAGDFTVGPALLRFDVTSYLPGGVMGQRVVLTRTSTTGSSTDDNNVLSFGEFQIFVPEPSSALLFALGSLALIRRRRKPA